MRRLLLYTLLLGLVFASTLLAVIWLTWHMPHPIINEPTCTSTQTNGTYHDFSPCFENVSFWSPVFWFVSSTPCDLGRLPLLYVIELCIDRFNIWEAAALSQTVLMAFILLLEARHGRHLKVITVCLIIVPSIATVSLVFTLSRIWLWQLASTLGFLAALSFADFLGYRQESSSAERALLRETFLFADVPLALSNFGLVSLLWSYDTPSNHVFFAGGTAFGLIFSNALILTLRIIGLLRHRRESR